MGQRLLKVPASTIRCSRTPLPNSVRAGILSVLTVTSPILQAQDAPARPPLDTVIYATEETRALVARAMARHAAADSLVADYQARLQYRASFAFGRRRWADPASAAVEEQIGTVSWSRPNDLRVDIAGRREESKLPGISLNSTFDEPWFVPRQLGDSVRLLSSEVPERAALHPLATGGPEFYRYEVVADQVTLTRADGQEVTIQSIRVTPRRDAASVVVGRLWIDRETGEVVRFTFRFVGTSPWDAPRSATARDSARARRNSQRIGRILTLDVDLEYALQEGRYWMPYRQILAGTVQVPVVADIVVPFEVISTFDDYRINQGRVVAFLLPETERDTSRAGRAALRDSLRRIRRGQLEPPDSIRWWSRAGRLAGGGRYEIHRAPEDSLRLFNAWEDQLDFTPRAADDARLRELRAELAVRADELPGSLTGRRSHGFGYERIGDAVRFNRVQGSALGLGYRVRVPGVPFTTAYGMVRYGTSDERVVARLTAVRDGPDGLLRVALYRDLIDLDPFSRGLTLANSLRAIISGRDEADYALATGGSIGYTRTVGRGMELTATARLERQRSVTSGAVSRLNDLFGGSGRFRENPPIRNGTFVGGLVTLDQSSFSSGWQLNAEVLAGDGTSTARVFGTSRVAFGVDAGVTLRAHGGVASRPLLPQMEFRAGGIGSVRGFNHGTQRGQAFWAVQADWAIIPAAVRPVLFLDAGQAGTLRDLDQQKVLVGGGAGLSILRGLLRFDLSHPITPDRGEGFRLDVLIGVLR